MEKSEEVVEREEISCKVKEVQKANEVCDERDKFCEKCTKASFFGPKQIKSPKLRNPNRGTKRHLNLAGPFKPGKNEHRYSRRLFGVHMKDGP